MSEVVLILVVLFILALIVEILPVILKKCSNCKKYGQLAIINKTFIDSWPTTKTVKKTDVSYKTDRYGIRDYNSRIETDREVEVAATAYKYRIQYRCKNCGYTFEEDVVNVK